MQSNFRMNKSPFGLLNSLRRATEHVDGARVPALLLACGMAVSALGSPARASSWTALYHSDPVVFAQQLRAAGFPENAVAALVGEQVQSRFVEQEQALQPSLASAAQLKLYWTPERREKLVLLRKEKNALLRAALGPLPDRRSESDWVALNLARLSIGQRETVRLILEDYDHLLERVLAETRGHFTQNDRDLIVYLESERENDLRPYLSESEIVDYQIQHSRFGAYVREELECFDVTPDEMRQYYRVGEKHRLHVLVFSLGSSERLQARRLADAELRGLWPAERFETLRRNRHHLYRTTFKLVNRLGLARSVADEVFDSRLALNTAMAPSRLRPRSGEKSGPSGSPPRSDRVRTELQQHLRVVATLLGETGLAEYVSVHGAWIEPMKQGSAVWFDLAP